MEPSEQNCNETAKEEKENCSESIINGVNEDTMKKRNVPVSSLSDDEATGTLKRAKTETDSTEERVFMSSTSNSSANDIVTETHTYGLPTIKIQPILGGKPLTFPVHPRLTILDLKDFILFALNIPHPQQILSFYCEEERKAVLLSNYSENTLLCTVPGLIDEITGRCAIVSLSFKMSSGMDFSINPSDVEYENTTGTVDSDDTGYFEVNSSNSDSPSDSKISSLASTLASIIPFPPGTSKSSRMLLRSLSKSSPTNSNLPTLWEIYFPESGVKMMVTALINVNEVKSDEERESERSSEILKDDLKEKKESEETKDTIKPASVPELVITPPDNTEHLEPVVPVPVIPSLTPSTPSNSEAPKTHCEKCHLRCRPALRFICKCTKTFCQSHRYPDQHNCTYDHRADGMASIQANNPKIVKDKVGNF